MAASNYKIGEVATRMGISVRTLRHYDEVGLLKPSSRTEAGHRLYTDRDIVRLQRIVALRKNGFSLAHIRTVLSGNVDEGFKTLEAQATRLRQQIAQQQEVLKNVEAALDFKEMFTRFKKPDIEPVKARSGELFAALTAEMERGTDPKAPRVQELVQQFDAFGREMLAMMGGDKAAETMKALKQNPHLIPQGDQRQVEAMREKMKPFKENMTKMFEYYQRAKA